MRLFLIIIIFISNLHCFAQKLTNDLQVTYQVYFDGDRKVTYPTVLHIRDNVTLYEMKISLSEAWDGQFKSEMPSFTVPGKAKKDSYLKINHNTKELLGFAALPGQLGSLVTDIYPKVKWVISKESKIIAGYNCTKATGTYRGREWIAWFTPEIALPYGPWKLHGLPGLIMEVKSTDDNYIMKVLKIERAKSDILDKDFKTLKPTYNKEPITFKQHLENEHEAFENMENKMRLEGIKVTSVTPPPSGYELKYEWEE